MHPGGFASGDNDPGLATYLCSRVSVSVSDLQILQDFDDSSLCDDSNEDFCSS